jgi:hypothetical protein
MEVGDEKELFRFILASAAGAATGEFFCCADIWSFRGCIFNSCGSEASPGAPADSGFGMSLLLVLVSISQVMSLFSSFARSFGG